jgi:hypothetical protein
MKARFLFASCLLAVLVVALAIPVSVTSSPAPAKDEQKSEKFGALAYMPSGAGPAMVGAGARVNVDIWVNEYTNDADAKVWAAALLEGGSPALLKKLEDAKTIGKIRMTGRAGFYDFKLIRQHRSEGGRRIWLIGDRPIGFLEVYAGNRSQDYPFGILQLDLKTNSKGKEEGTGALIYAGKIKVMEGNNIELETYGIEPIRLLGVRKL